MGPSSAWWRWRSSCGSSRRPSTAIFPVGGADPATGSGLRGIADRVQALNGHLQVMSPVGVGTTVRAEIPRTPQSACTQPASVDGR